MIAQSLEKLSAVDQSSNPFPGLRPFEYHQSHLFFGREGQSEELMAKLSRTRFLAVVGTSGSGKSSLVRAGLLPALIGGMMSSAGSQWRIAIMRPGKAPTGNLAQALNQPDVFGSEDAADRALQTELTEAALRRGSQGLVEIVRQNNLGASENFLILVDQFEELFSKDQGAARPEHDDERAAFVKLLIAANKQAEIPIYVVITMRSDYLGDCAKFLDLPEAINESQYLIPRLNREQRREVIMGPIAVAGGSISPRLVDRLLNDIGDNQDQLPILQHALMRTWEKWKADGSGPLDLEHYEAIGGFEKALSMHADEAFNDLPDERSKLTAKKIFKCLTGKSDAKGETRRSAEISELCKVAEADEEEVKRVIEIFRLPGRSFLTPSSEIPLKAESEIDISHESLIRNWKRLKEWAEEEARSARIYQRLAETAVLYGQNEAALWRDPDLHNALDWFEKNKPNEYWARRYNPEYEKAMAFMRESEAKEKEEVDERERRQKAELVAAQSLAEERNRRFKLLLFLFALALASAIAAFILYRRAETEKDKADAIGYVATMNLLQQDYDNNNFSRGSDLLEDFIPASQAGRGRKEIRSFAWYYLWNLFHDEKATLKPFSGTVNSVAYSPDGSIFASAGWDRIKLWDAVNLTEIGALKGQSEGINSLAFSPDGAILASGGGDKTIKVWDYKNLREIASLNGHTDRIFSVAISPDGSMLASGSADKTIRLWNLKTRGEIKILEGHTSSVRSVAFSPNGLTLASGSQDARIKLWDLKTFSEIQSLLPGHEDSVFSIAFSPDGTMLASGSADNTIKLWDLKTSKEKATLSQHLDSVVSVAFSPDGLTLASGSEDRTIRLWEISNLQAPITLKGHAEDVADVAFSPDGRSLASGGYDELIKIWDVKNIKRVDVRSGHTQDVYSVAISPDGNMAASGGRDGMIRLWDIHSQNEYPPLSGHMDSVFSVAFSPDGALLASGSADKTIKLWDLAASRELANLANHSGSVRGIAFSPDGRILASAGWDKTIKLWDVKSFKEISTLNGHTGEVYSVAFSPDGNTLASASWDGMIKLWDVKNSKETATLGHHWNSTLCAIFSPDGRVIASGGLDNTIRLWDIKASKEIAVFKGHQEFVSSLAFTPDGKTLASSSPDNIIKLWDIKYFKELAALKGHTGNVWALAFSPRSRTLVSAGADKTIRIWSGAADEQIERQKNR